MSIKTVKKLILICGIGALPLLYNQCSARHQGVAISSGQSKSFNGDCASVDEVALFSTSFAPFLRTNCSSCHIQGGQGKGAFASSIVNVAWNAFRPVGYKKIAQFAIDPGHNPPYSGPQHEVDAQILKFEWEQGLVALQKCDALNSAGEFVDDPFKDKRISFNSQGLSPDSDGETKTLSWNVNSSMLPPPTGVTLPDVPGAEISISYIAKRDVVTGITYYEFFDPTASGSTSDLIIKSLRLKINGQFIPNETTFTFMDATYRSGSPAKLLETGRMTAISPVLQSDVVTLTFGEISTTTLPPIDDSLEVNFNVATQAATEGAAVTFQIELNQAVSGDSLVTIEIGIAGSSTATAKCCNIIETFSNGNQPIDNFDFDYEMTNITLANDRILLTFIPPDQTFDFTLSLENDDRNEGFNESTSIDDNPEVIKFEILSFDIHKSSASVPGKIGAIGQTTITILDDDPPAIPGSITLSSLLSPGGILRDNCVKCHNPHEKLEGLAVPYVMTTYANLIDQNRLIPSSPTTSLLYLRMNGDVIPGNGSLVLPPMPLDGLLDQNIRLDVEQWIKNGAPNN